MRARAPNATALVAGLVVVCLGILIVLERGGDVDLDFAELGPSLTAAAGAILLSGGLARRRGDRG